MRKYGLILAALAAAFAAAAGPAAAATTGAAPAATALPVLSVVVGSGTPPAAPGDLLSATLTAGTTFAIATTPGGSVGLFCNSSTWTAKLMTNPTVPGPAQMQVLPPLTVGSCLDSNPGVTSVTGVSVANLPNILQVNGGTFATQLLPMSSPLQITVVGLSGNVTFTCVYQAPVPLPGTAGPGAGPWKFTGQPLNLVSAPMPQCGPSPSFLTVSYSPVTDTTLGGQVIVN